MADIYALYSTRDGKVRYVGQTTYTYTDRFKRHTRAAEDWVPLRLYKWFQAEWKLGYPVRCQLLESCNDEARHQLEWDWIKKFPASDLLNERKNIPSEWRSRIRNPPKIREIERYMRGHRFNVGGFHGVHYSIGLDRYCVLIYAGSKTEWLIGDAPGSGGWSIWFSDLNAALNARDARRRRQPLYFLPDRDR